VAPAIVALQRQAEEIRQAELRRVQIRLGSLSAEQVAAVEALTRGLVNKFFTRRCKLSNRLLVRATQSGSMRSARLGRCLPPQSMKRSPKFPRLR